MGAVTFSIDKRLIERLQQHLPFDTFIETGTFRGETIGIVKPYFQHIYSIELSSHYYEEAVRVYGHDNAVSLFHGNSATMLRTIVSDTKDKPTLYWLDAHWCVADATAGELSQCPLLDELDAIQILGADSMIIIDDARLFLAAPQAPHEISNWPSFDAIAKRLYTLSPDHQLCVLNDCILFYPPVVAEEVKQFAHEYGTDWLDVMNRCRDTEALLAKVCAENEMFHNMGIGKRIRGIVGYAKRQMISKIKSPTMVQST